MTQLRSTGTIGYSIGMGNISMRNQRGCVSETYPLKFCTVPFAMLALFSFGCESQFQIVTAQRSGTTLQTALTTAAANSSLPAVSPTPKSSPTPNPSPTATPRWFNAGQESIPTGLRDTIRPAVVWTGDQAIVWGSYAVWPTANTFCDHRVGGRYDPATDRWLPVSKLNAPGLAWSQSAVWTGSEMIVWGSSDPDPACPGENLATGTATGGRYNPSTDTWRPMSSVGAPMPYTVEYQTYVVWTGRKMLVWSEGGDDYNYRSFVGLYSYDPITDEWTTASKVGQPGARGGVSMAWTGSDVIVWGGTPQLSLTGLRTGALYNPDTDTWRPMSTQGLPPGLVGGATVPFAWSSQFGLTVLKCGLGGAIYSPSADSWTTIPNPSASPCTRALTSPWTSMGLVMFQNSGSSVYQPDSKTWVTLEGSVPLPVTSRALWLQDRLLEIGGGANLTYRPKNPGDYAVP